MTEEAKTYTKHTRNRSRTVNLFPWGNGWRVKYTVTDMNRDQTHLLQHTDEEFDTLTEAQKAYTQIVMAMEP